MTPTQTAYQRCKLAQYGISYERAMAEPMFAMCLKHVANGLEKIKQPPLPSRAATTNRLPYKDD